MHMRQVSYTKRECPYALRVQITSEKAPIWRPSCTLTPASCRARKFRTSHQDSLRAGHEIAAGPDKTFLRQRPLMSRVPQLLPGSRRAPSHLLEKPTWKRPLSTRSSSTLEIPEHPVRRAWSQHCPSLPFAWHSHTASITMRTSDHHMQQQACRRSACCRFTATRAGKETSRSTTQPAVRRCPSSP